MEKPFFTAPSYILEFLVVKSSICHLRMVNHSISFRVFISNPHQPVEVMKKAIFGIYSLDLSDNLGDTILNSESKVSCPHLITASRSLLSYGRIWSTLNLLY